MTPTEKARRVKALFNDRTKQELAEMVVHRESDLEELRELCSDMYQRLQWADVLMDGGALDARLMRRTRELGVFE